MDIKLTPEERIYKAKIRLGEDPPSGRPFFSYLVSHLRVIETDKVPSMGVDKNGNCYYNPKFVEKLSDEELKGVICHEIFHVVLEHLTRSTEMRQDHMLSNIAQDIIVNNVLIKDNFALPEGGTIPSKDDTIMIDGYKVERIGEKSSDEIYDELYRHLKKKYKKQIQQMQNLLDKLAKKGFDEHIKGSGGDEEKDRNKDKQGSSTQDLPKPNEQEISKDWKKVLLDAASHARNKGCVPAGLDRIIDKVMEPKVNWRTYLFKFITAMIPTDFTWGYPSKKSFSTGIYLPTVEKESIEVITAIDTSGSISEVELQQFLGEVVSVTRSFRNVDLTVIVCDAEVNGVFTFKQANVEDVIKKIGLKGGGGTSHIPVFDWIKKNKPQAKFVICFTDGYTEFPDKHDVKIQTLWVVAGGDRLDKEEFPFGDVIHIPMSEGI